MNIHFRGTIWFWRGPAPWYFVTVPPRQSEEMKAVSASVSYGWGMIPVKARIGGTEWETSLFPKEGRYIVPIKASIRKAEDIHEGDEVTIYLQIGASSTW